VDSFLARFQSALLVTFLRRLIENPLAQHILQGEFAEGDTLLVDAQNGEIVFTKAKAKKAKGVSGAE